MKNTEMPFYLKTWFIALLFSLWQFIFVTAIIGLILLFLRNKKYTSISKDTYDKYGNYDSIIDKISTAEKQHAEKISTTEKQHAEKISTAEKQHAEKINEFKHQVAEYESNSKNLKYEIECLNEELNNLQNISVYEFSQIEYDDEITSAELKSKLAILKLDEKDLIKSNAALLVDDELSRKEATAQSKQILRSFDSEIKLLFSSLTLSNTDATRTKIVKSFETLNRIYKIDGIALTDILLKNKLQQLDLMNATQVKIQQEKEQQQAIKEQMKEEERVRREIENEKKKIEKEEKQFSNEVKKLMDYLAKTDNDVEKQLYADKIRELEEKLKVLDADKERVNQREANTRAGFVYIISNIGSFGENVYKIGMTRRLEPMDRVNELGSASVPFEFDVHAMIFSEDAPGLENMLHNEFRNNQVNKVNPRKEFFRVDLTKIADVVKEKFNSTTEFTMVAKAEQYRESLKLEQTA